MTDLEDRRKAQFPQYERPLYYGIMRPWRAEILRDWLKAQEQVNPPPMRFIAHDQEIPAEMFTGVMVDTYLDIGCGPAESITIAHALRYKDPRGCDVVQSVCNRADVDLIPGAHDLSIYDEDQFDISSCNDVLEHILEEDVSAALSEIHRVTKHASLLGICRKPGTFHITVKSEEWWMEKIAENMPRRKATIVFAERVPKVKRPYLWVSVQ